MHSNTTNDITKGIFTASNSKIQKLLASISLLLFTTLMANSAFAGLQLSVISDSSSVQPNQISGVKILVSNDGASPETGLSLQMQYPADLNAIGENAISGPFDAANSCSGAGASTTCSSTEFLNWNIGTLNAGQIIAISLFPSVTAVAADGTTITFEAELSQNAVLSLSDSSSFEVDSNADLHLSIDENSDPAAAGTQLTYTLHYGNTSGSSVTSTALSLELPGNTSFVSASGGGLHSNGMVTWNLNTLASGQSGRLQVITTVSGAAATGSLLKASASINGTSQATFGATQQQTGSTSHVASSPLLKMAINTAERVNPSDVLPLELVISNPSNTQVLGASLKMRYPASLNGLGENTISGPFDAANSCSNQGAGTTCSEREFLNWTLGTLNPGQVITITLPPLVSPSAANGSLIVFEPAVSVDGVIVLDETQTVVVDSNADLRLAIDTDQNPVVTGSQLVYTLHYGNTAATSVTGTALTFTVPAGSSFVSATNGGVHSNGVVSWNLNTLASGQAGQLQVITNVSATAAGSLLEASASMNATSQSTFLATQQRASNAAHIATAPLLALSLNTAERVNPNNILPVEITISNPSLTQVVGATLQLRYPQNLNGLVENNISGPFDAAGSCSNQGAGTACSEREFLNWTLGTLNPGQTITITLPPIVSPSAENGSLIELLAAVSVDGNIIIEEAQTVIVDSNADLRLAIDEDNDPVSAGDTLTYTLHYGNTSASSTTNSTLTFPIPTGLSFISATDGGIFNSGNVTWNLNTLAAGQAGQLQVITTVSGSAADGSLVEASATLEGTSQATFLATQQQAGSTAHVANTPLLALSLNVPERINPSANLPIEIMISNPSMTQVVGATLQMRYPQHLNGLSENSISGPFNAADSCFNQGASTTCSTREFLKWTLGTLNPGKVIRITLPPTVNVSAANGSLLELTANLSVDGAVIMDESQSVIIDANANLHLSIDEDNDSIDAGDQLTYIVRYGNTSATSVTNTALSFTLPEGSSFVAATIGGEFEDGVVSWNLGTIASGEAGQLKIRTTASGSANAGALLESNASITGTSQTTFLTTRQQAESIAYITPSKLMSLDLSLTTQPILAGGQLAVSMQVSNLSNAQVFGANLSLRFPDGLNGLSENSVSGPFDTANSCSSLGAGTTCSSREFLIWNVGTLNPGQTVEVDLPPVVSNVLANGNLLKFLAELTDDTGSLNSASISLPISVGSDTDNDGLGGVFDNCTAIANANQANFDLDLLGDVCDTDDDNDGLSDVSENQIGTDPFDSDTDDDGMPDGMH